MSQALAAASLSPVAPEADGETPPFGKTQEELAFWLKCVGAPLVVVEKNTLTMRSANRTAALFFGLEQEAFAQASIAQLVGDEATQILRQIWSNSAFGVPGEPFLLRAVLRGQERLLMVQVSRLQVEGETLRLFSFADAPPQGSAAFAGWQENITDLLNWLPFGFEISSSDEQIQFANSHFLELFGYAQEEIESIEDWWRLAYPDPDYRQFARALWDRSITAARAENREMTPFDLEVATADGSRRTIQFRHRSIRNFNVNLYVDVSQERAHARELKVLAETDPLTGIMNRRRFFDEAARLYQSYCPLPSSTVAIMLDIDHFKQINDVHGHAAGDLVLAEFTRRCRRTTRSRDLLARLGGEEFAILLTDVDEVTASEIANRMLAEIAARPFQLLQGEIAVTVSIGVAMRRRDDASVEATLSRADKALYQAKELGRNRIVIET